MMRIATQLSAAICTFALTSYSLPASAQSGRPFSIDDVLKMHQILAVSRSADGEHVAVVVERPAAAGEMYARPNARSDVWVIGSRDGVIQKITDGVKNQSGYWSPNWSPDGRKLAFFGITGTDPVRLYTWDRASRSSRLVTERNVDPYVQINDRGETTPLLWLSNSTLLVTLRAGAGAGGRDLGQLAITQPAIDGWKKAQTGSEPTASIVTSGDAKPAGPVPPKTLAIVEIGGRVTPVLETSFTQVHLAPTRAHLAIAVDDGMRPPRAGQVFRFTDSRRWKLGVANLTGNGQVRWIAGLTTAGAPAPVWSPDGASMALTANETENGDGQLAFRIDVGRDSARPVLPVGWKAQSVAWTSRSELLTLAMPPGDKSPDTTKKPRSDWFAVDQAAPRNLTASMKAAPGALRRGPGSVSLGIASDTLWSIDAAVGAVRPLSSGLTKVTSIIWPKGDAGTSSVIIQAGEPSAPTLHRVTVSGPPGATPVASPDPLVTLQHFDSTSGSTVFSGALPTGTFLWFGNGAAGFRRVLALNEFIAGVTEGKRMLIEYTGVEGDTLKALVVLPVGYEQGKRYPAVAWVYAGSTRTDTVYSLVDKHFVHGLNLQVLPANGYVLVIPSMPLAADGVASDPYIDLPKGVLGAMDKVVALGIADAAKLGVMGQSYGGYSTMSLITYTNRFKAAVELAGPPDLISFYTVFEPTERYRPDAHESMFAPRWSESGQGRMGKPPWDDLWRYLRNSPLYYVERVNTPLLLLQGDLDFVSLIGGEQFFTALHRLGKPARFVRYWGEGHVLDSPANIRHQWGEITAWFDRYLKGTGAGSSGDRGGR